MMIKDSSIVAIFSTHREAELAIKALSKSGVPLKALSIVGKGYHTDEHVTGFYNIDNRVKFWGVNGAFWGGLWGLFFGGLFITLPVTGPVVVLGYVATTIIATLESALLFGGLSALGAALYSIGIPKDSIFEYEAAVKADGFIVMVHGTEDDVMRAKGVLDQTNPLTMETHDTLRPTENV